MVVVVVVSGGGGGECWCSSEGGWHKVIAQRSLVSVAAKSLKQLDIKWTSNDAQKKHCTPHTHTV